MKESNLALKMTLAFIGIMGVAMFVSNYVFGYAHGNVRMLDVLLGYLIIATMYSILAYRIYFQKKGFKNFQQIKLTPLFFVFAIGISTTFFIYLVTGDFTTHIKSFPIIVLTTLLIAISEELIFRGLLLQDLLKKYSTMTAIFLSAGIFSLYHLVNLLAGITLHSMFIQLLSTFIYGIIASSFAIKLKNILPIMLFHWIWDLMVITLALVGTTAEPFIVGMSVVGIVSATTLLFSTSLNNP